MSVELLTEQERKHLHRLLSLAAHIEGIHKVSESIREKLFYTPKREKEKATFVPVSDYDDHIVSEPEIGRMDQPLGAAPYTKPKIAGEE